MSSAWIGTVIHDVNIDYILSKAQNDHVLEYNLKDRINRYLNSKEE